MRPILQVNNHLDVQEHHFFVNFSNDGYGLM